MRTIPLIVALAAFLIGCANPAREAQLRALEERMRPEWLKANMIIGQTTPSQVIEWFGPPRNRTTVAGGGPLAAGLFDEMWTYSIRFSEQERSWQGSYSVHRFHTLVVSWKDGVVASYSSNTIE